MAGLRKAADNRRDLDACHFRHSSTHPIRDTCGHRSRRAFRRRVRFVEQFESQYIGKSAELLFPDLVVAVGVSKGQRVG
jgi:hypothetical protein